MKLYKISQNTNHRCDTYESAIVCAENEEEARTTYPYEMVTEEEKEWFEKWREGKLTYCSDWCLVKEVIVEYVGEAREGMKKGVIIASFFRGG